MFKVNGFVLVFLLFSLNIFHTFFSISVVNFKHLFVCWEFRALPLISMINSGSTIENKHN